MLIASEILCFFQLISVCLMFVSAMRQIAPNGFLFSIFPGGGVSLEYIPKCDSGTTQPIFFKSHLKLCLDYDSQAT